MAEIVEVRSGRCRNNDSALTHTYAEMSDGKLLPMCEYGWNRSRGAGFSIFRGTPDSEGDCKLCAKRVRKWREGKTVSPVEQATGHKTKWIC